MDRELRNNIANPLDKYLLRKNKPIVLVTRPISEVGLNILKTDCEIIINRKNAPLPYRELMNNVKGVDAILCFLNDKIDKQIIDVAGRSLKVISTFRYGLRTYRCLRSTQERNKDRLHWGYTHRNNS